MQRRASAGVVVRRAHGFAVAGAANDARRRPSRADGW
jgi:hypothetical protein